MNRFIIEENEKEKILSLHKSLIKKSILNNVMEQSTTTPVVNTDEKILREAMDAGCLRNGSLKTNKAGTRTIYRATTKSGKSIVFNADMTYAFEDGSKSGKWKCSRIQDVQSKLKTLKDQGWKTKEELMADNVDLNTLSQTYDTTTIEGTNITLYRLKGAQTTHFSGTSTQEFNVNQQSFIDDYLKKGYILNPTRSQQQYMESFTAEDLGAPPDLFPNGLTMWYDPRQQSQMGSDDRPLKNILDSQDLGRKTCKNNINDYYRAYLRRNSIKITKADFIPAKKIVQACKDQWYKKWPALSGGKKLDNYLNILSGVEAGGPIGEYEYFKLK